MESCTNLISFFDRDSFDDFLVDDSSHDGDASFQPSSTETDPRENSPSESLGAETNSEASSTISSVYSNHCPHILHLVFLIRDRSQPGRQVTPEPDWNQSTGKGGSHFSLSRTGS